LRAILLDAAVIEAAAAPLVTCEAVIAESCYLLRKQAGAADAILENVKTGVFQIPLQLSRATHHCSGYFENIATARRIWITTLSSIAGAPTGRSIFS
jgi:hypothetical protein